MKKTLWSHDFIIITLGTLISAIGSTAMSFALSLVVFDHTSSTLMTGIFTAISLMPTVLIPILAAPLVDGCCRKRLIVMLDSGNGILYLLFAAFLLMQDGCPVSSLSAHGCQSVYLRLSGHQFPEYTGGQYTKLFALSHAGKGECVVSGAGCPHYDGFQIQRRCNCTIRILPVDGTAVCFVFDACYLPADYPQQEAGFKNL